MARKTPPPRSPQLKLAGAPCVAFINTAAVRPDNRQQGVENFPQLLTWCRQAGTLSDAEAERLHRWAAERPEEAAAVFALAAEVRASLARVFVAIQRQEPLSQEDLEPFNRALAASSLEHRLVAAEPGAAWGWIGDQDALDSVLSPILRSAVEVMAAAAGRPHVRQCAGKECQLFFVDRSPSGQRKWCDSKTCGHRAANLRYYYRTGKAERARRWITGPGGKPVRLK